MTLMAQNKNIYILRRDKVTSVLSILQAHSAFRCVVMGANAKRCSRRRNEIIVSKRELQVKTLTSVFLRNSVLLHYIIAVHFVRLQ